MASFEDSLLWELPEFQKLVDLPRVRAFVWGRRCVGGPRGSTAKWVTTAEWLGLAERAAGCPEGSCEAMAEAYARAPPRRYPRLLTWFTPRGRYDPMAPETRAQQRERENEEAIGGMRNPHLSLDKVPGWRAVGPRLTQALDAALDELSEQRGGLSFILDALGKDECEGLPEETVSRARQLIADAFEHATGGAARPEPAAPADRSRGLQPALFGKLLAAAADPDTSLTDWAHGQTPLGVAQRIPVHGIFPTTPTVDEGASDDVSPDDFMANGFSNYPSFVEHQAGAERVFLSELEKGYLEWAPSKEGFEASLGKLILSKVAVIRTVKAGREKFRLIHDLRRSGVNERARIPERCVLPRLRDAVETMLKAARAQPDPARLRVVVIDFTDAFKQLIVHPSERRFLAGKAPSQGTDGFFVYLVLLFGHIAGPLV